MHLVQVRKVRVGPAKVQGCDGRRGLRLRDRLQYRVVPLQAEATGSQLKIHRRNH